LFVISIAPERERDAAAELSEQVAGGLDAEQAPPSRDGSFQCPRCGSFNDLGADDSVRLLTRLVERVKLVPLYMPGANQ
jgi:hypothetical protein